MLYFVGLVCMLLHGMLLANGEQPFASHTLLCFVDREASELDAISYGALTALEQKVSPVLISAQVMQFILEMPSIEDIMRMPRLDAETRRNASALKIYYDALNRELQKLMPADAKFLSLEDQKKISMQFNKIIHALVESDLGKTVHALTWTQCLDAALLKTAIAFKPEDWHVFVVNTDFLLLVPKAYAQHMEKKYAHAMPKQDTLTLREYALGLRVDHLKEIVELRSHLGDLKKTDERDVNILAALKQVFIERKTYGAIKAPFVPSWALYMLGHGGLGTVMFDMPVLKFKPLFDFFETAIATKLVAYSSCYSAGVNARLLYRDFTRDVEKTFSYAIAFEAVADVAVMAEALHLFTKSFTRDDIDFINRRIVPRVSRHFDQFVRAATSDMVNYQELLAPVFPVARGLLVKEEVASRAYTVQSLIQNMPQIRLPGLPWFSIVDVDNKIVSIGQVLAQSGRKELDVNMYFKRKPLGILIYSSYLPFTLKIKQDSMPKIIFMVNQPMYYMAGLEVKMSFDAVLAGFSLVQEGLSKTVWINKLNDLGTIILDHVQEHELAVYRMVEDKQGKRLEQYGNQTWVMLEAELSAQILQKFKEALESDYGIAVTLEKIDAREKIAAAEKKKHAGKAPGKAHGVEIKKELSKD